MLENALCDYVLIGEGDEVVSLNIFILSNYFMVYVTASHSQLRCHM